MRKELSKLREVLKEKNIDVFITADADDHVSEYPSEHFACMKYISGFTGTDGTLVVTPSDAGLWTDGRYFIQAAAELSGSGITLMKMGEPGCPDMTKWIYEHLPEGGKIAFDGRCVSASYAEKLLRAVSGKKAEAVTDQDPVGEIWNEGRPPKKADPLWILSEKYAGKSVSEKLCDLKSDLSEKGAEAHIITAMDDIAWLLNLRGSDIPFCPVFDAFLMTEGDKVKLYVSEEHLTEETAEYLSENKIEVCTETEKVYEDAGHLSVDAVLIDKESTSRRMLESIPENVYVIDSLSPVTVRKNRKNPVEAENLRKAQLKDSVAVTKYMYWFKKHVHEGNLTECNTASKLHEFRKEQEGFLLDSFETISAYGENAAMCHYAPSEDRDVKILPKGLYLVDSGGHYYEGSTDITRTWACGPLTDEEKKGCTLTAIANLRLSDLEFKEGTSGQTVDLAARSVFWKEGLDYNHGTGHGVGYLLNVHEGPAGIRPKVNASAAYGGMYEGVYVSDEPGLYIEGKYGVRLENMLLCVKDFTNEYGTFMHFDVLTTVPFDRDAIDKSLMEPGDILLYDRYHKRVFETISPYLDDEERDWLRKICMPL